MTRNELIWNAYNRGEIPQDTAGFLTISTNFVRKAIERGYITPEFGRELLQAPIEPEY